MAAIMEHPASSMLLGGRPHYYYEDPDPRPPWDQRPTAQVPYMPVMSTRTNQAKQQAVPNPWDPPANAASYRSNSNTPPRDTDHTHNGRSNSTSDGTQGYAPRSAPLPSRPQHSPIPQGPMSARDVPTFVPPAPAALNIYVPRRPSTNTPPAESTFCEAPRRAPSVPQASPSALPGTMSTRENDSSGVRTKASSRKQADSPVKGKGESVGIGKRFKAALKDLFRREPVNDSEFERIEDRHWTDD